LVAAWVRSGGRFLFDHESRFVEAADERVWDSGAIASNEAVRVEVAKRRVIAGHMVRDQAVVDEAFR